MPWKDNFDLFQLFITKTVHVWEEDSDNDATKAAFDIVLPTIKQFYEREDISLTYNFCTMSESKLAQFNPIIAAKNGDVKHCSFFNLLTGLVFDFGMFKEYMHFVGMLRSGLKSIIPSIVFFSETLNSVQSFFIIISPQIIYLQLKNLLSIFSILQ